MACNQIGIADNVKLTTPRRQIHETRLDDGIHLQTPNFQLNLSEKDECETIVEPMRPHVKKRYLGKPFMFKKR